MIYFDELPVKREDFPLSCKKKLKGIGYHGNMLYCIQGGPTKQLSWIITPITSNNCWATIVNRVYEPTYNWWLACIM